MEETQDTVMQSDDQVLVIESVVPDIDTQFEVIQQNFTKLKTSLSDMQQQLRTLEKTIKKDKKEQALAQAKQVQVQAKQVQVQAQAKQVQAKPVQTKLVPEKAGLMRQPKIIGFDIPEKITSALCAFMKLPAESMTTRNAATRYITEYIREHKLQDMTDRKCIHCNEELTALLKLAPTQPLTYFNLHKYISVLFIR
jgi:hypothetical protein